MHPKANRCIEKNIRLFNALKIVSLPDKSILAESFNKSKDV